MNRLIAFVGFVFVATAATPIAQTSTRPSVFTAEQAETGQKQLQNNAFGPCSDCHGTSLGGRTGAASELPRFDSLRPDYQALISGNDGKVPDLVGPAFRRRWAARSTKKLTGEFLERFGPTSGGLDEQTRLNLIAYFLQANGALAGSLPLTMDTDVEIGTLFPEVNPR